MAIFLLNRRNVAKSIYNYYLATIKNHVAVYLDTQNI